MLSYARLRSNRREFLAFTGLTAAEFEPLLGVFARAYERRHPAERTMGGGPRQREAGGGRRAILGGAEQRLLFILVYLKAYPLQVLMGELFGLSQPTANRWVHRLLPVLREALNDLGVVPERDPARFAGGPPPAVAAGEGPGPRDLIIDGTERPRQRPKDPREQALHYSGKRKTHTDKNVLIVGAKRKGVGFLSRTYPGKAHDKGIAAHEAIAYPPGAVLHKDLGFQGYEPDVAETRQAKKKAARPRTHGRGEAGEPPPGPLPGQSGARHRRRQTLPRREGRVAQHQGRVLRLRHGGRLRTAQPPGPQPQATPPQVAINR
jgi:hypothetical protein